jgi:hypothetical protein
LTRARKQQLLPRPTLAEVAARRDGPTLGTVACAAVLNMNPDDVRLLIEAGGGLRGFRIGRNWRVLWVSLRSYLLRSGLVRREELGYADGPRFVGVRTAIGRRRRRAKSTLSDNTPKSQERD